MQHENLINIENMYHLVTRSAELYGDKPVFKFNKKSAEVSVTYSEFSVLVKKTALAFEALGMKGKRLMVIGDTSVQWITAYCATVIADGVIIPLDPYLLEDELIKFVNRSQASFIVCEKKFTDIFSARENEIPGVEKIITTDVQTFDMDPEEGSISEKYIDFNTLLADGNSRYTEDTEFDMNGHDTEAMRALLFTSGTTGTSKGVMLSEKNICTVINGAVKLLNKITYEDTLLSVLPIFHTYEMTCGILSPIALGCTICISDGLRYVSRNMKQFAPTVMAIVPMFAEHLYKTIWDTARSQGRDKVLKNGLKISRTLGKVHIDVRRKLFAQVIAAMGGRLKYLVVGGAAMNPQLSENFADMGIKISQGYGITECSPLISVMPFDEVNHASCGRLMPGMQIFIDKEKADDTYGEIVVKGDNVMLGYYDDEEQTADVLSKGWFRTGDYGYIDDKGYIYITGRKKNVIVLSGGKNVFPEEIEEYLSEIPLIEEVVVAGINDEKTGELIVAAYVYPNADECTRLGLNSGEEIRTAMTNAVQAINKKIGSHKRVQKIILRDKPFEKTTTRKIKRQSI